MREQMMTIGEIAGILGGERYLRSETDTIGEFITDTRWCMASGHSLFFAIPTSSGDGHLHLRNADEISNFVISDPKYLDELKGSANVILVPDTLQALRRLAAHRRTQARGTMLAVTGSKGKTTLKEWLYAALSCQGKAYRSPRSFNSHIGVPISLAGIPSETCWQIVEAGISRKGEMEGLAELIAPDVAVFVSLGQEHDSGFASLDEKASEKALLGRQAGICVYDEDSLFAPHMKGEKSVTWSRKNTKSALFIEDIIKTESGVSLKGRINGAPATFMLPFAEDGLVETALAFITTLTALGWESDAIAAQLAALRPIDTRIDVTDGVNDCLVAYDTFTNDADNLPYTLDFANRRLSGTEDDRSLTLILSQPHSHLAEYDAHLRGCSRIKRVIRIGKDWADAHRPDSFVSADEFMKKMSTSDFINEFIVIKDSPEKELHRIHEMLEARTHETVLEVNLNALVRNYNYFRGLLPASTGLIAMVKASGYGVGSLEVAKTLQAQGASYLAVAVLDEGIELRRAGVSMPIMVMNPKVLNYRAMFEYRLEPEIYSAAILADVIREAEKCGIEGYPVHIKLDTGMHRMGFNPDETAVLTGMLANTGRVRAATLFSHLATADCPEMDEYTLGQIELFEGLTREIMGALPYGVKRHILNSAGIVRFPQAHYDFARLGIGLYGVNTLPPEMEEPLSTVATLSTIVIALSDRKKGDSIGYGRRGMLQKPAKIATIPIGYADGMRRHFGNGRSRVFVNGHLCPTVGNVCMDACMIDVTGVPCRVGDRVEIFGSNIPVNDLADILDTIPYEILTSVSPRVKRIYYRE